MYACVCMYVCVCTIIYVYNISFPVVFDKRGEFVCLCWSQKWFCEYVFAFIHSHVQKRCVNYSRGI